MLAHTRYRPPGRSVTARWKPLGPDSAGGTDHGVQFQSSRYCGYPNQTSSTSAVSARPLPVSPPPPFSYMSAMRYIRPRYCWLCSVTSLALAAASFCLCHPCPRAVAVRLRDGTVTPSLIPSFSVRSSLYQERHKKSAYVPVCLGACARDEEVAFPSLPKPFAPLAFVPTPRTKRMYIETSRSTLTSENAPSALSSPSRPIFLSGSYA